MKNTNVVLNKEIRGGVVVLDDGGKLNPNWITGFSDAEGCFYIKIKKNKSYSAGWVVELNFQIGLHQKDRPLLELIQLFFGVGKIYKLGKDSIQYRVTSHKDLAVVIDHFDKYPLITQKRTDCEFFKQAIEIIKRKQHLTIEGLQKLVAIKASINLGLSEKLKAAFPNTIPVSKPAFEFTGILDPHWVVGFVDGEGCFFINHYKSSTRKLGFGVQCVFYITQHTRDAELINSLKNFFGCGRYRASTGQDWGNFIVTHVSILTRVVLFFLKRKKPAQSKKKINKAAAFVGASLAHVARCLVKDKKYKGKGFTFERISE